MAKHIHARLRGAPWSIRYPAKLPKADRDAFGTCQRRSVTDGTLGGLIRVRGGIQGRKRLEVELHESLHACLWDLDEEAIRETAEDIARFLWRAGYRLPSEPDA